MSDLEAIDHSTTLGILLFDLGYMDQAETMYLRALAGYEREVGLNHPQVPHIYNNLGPLYQKTAGASNKAEEMYARALAGMRMPLSPEYISTLKVMNNIGSMYLEQGRLAEAEEILTSVLTEGEKHFGHDHV